MAGVIGWPIEHSLSPQLHTAAYQALGMQRDYVRLPVPPGEMAEAVARLSTEGFVGATVTMPHKDAAADSADALTPDAARLHAVNTLVVTPEQGVTGSNTDAPGFENFLRDDAHFDASGATVLLYGAGGAARAVALAVSRAGAAELVVALRDPSKQEGFAALIEPGTQLEFVHLDGQDPWGRAASPQLLVNATPVGQSGDRLPLPTLSPSTTVVDLLYSPARTPLMEAARAAGAAAFGGLGLLVHQAALSFEIWTGSKAPMRVMRESGRTALASGG